MALASFCAFEKFNYSGPIAQLAEQRTLNPQVEGSIPSGVTKDAAASHGGGVFL